MKRWLLIPDVHVPSHDKRACEAVMAYASTQRYDGLVQLGDLVDLDSLNGHNRDQIGHHEGQRLRKELEAGLSFLEDLVGAARRLNPLAESVYLLGNHEARLDRESSRVPAYMGLTSIREALDCERLGVKVLPYRKRKSQFRIGKLHTIHGSFAGEGAVKKHLDRLSCSFVMGHTHRLQVITKPSQHGTMLGASIGYLGDPDLGESYLDGPEGWQQAFAEAFILPNGDFFLYPIPVVRGSFVAPNGRYYSYRGWDRLGTPSLLSESTTPASASARSQSTGGQARAPAPERSGGRRRRSRKSSSEAKARSTRGTSKRGPKSRGKLIGFGERLRAGDVSALPSSPPKRR